MDFKKNILLMFSTDFHGFQGLGDLGCPASCGATFAAFDNGVLLLQEENPGPGGRDPRVMEARKDAGLEVAWPAWWLMTGDGGWRM
jgi:hypothetical protein